MHLFEQRSPQLWGDRFAHNFKCQTSRGEPLPSQQKLWWLQIALNSFAKREWPATRGTIQSRNLNSNQLWSENTLVQGINQVLRARPATDVIGRHIKGMERNRSVISQEFLARWPEEILVWARWLEETLVQWKAVISARNLAGDQGRQMCPDTKGVGVCIGR